MTVGFWFAVLGIIALIAVTVNSVLAVRAHIRYIRNWQENEEYYRLLVSSFQRDHDILVDGVIGDRTREAIERYIDGTQQDDSAEGTALTQL